MKKMLLQILLGIAAIAAMAVLITKTVSLDDATSALKALSWGSLALIAIGVLLISATKALRFYFILQYARLQAPLVRTLRTFLATQAFTPLPGGEVMRAMTFRRVLPAHLSEVAGPVLLQATLEMWSAMCWVIVSALIVTGEWSWWLTVLLAVQMVTTAPLFFTPQIMHGLKRLAERGYFTQWIGKISKTLENFHKLVTGHDQTGGVRFWFKAIGAGLVSHALAGALMWYIAGIEGVHLTFFQGVFAATLGTLIQGIASIIPGGLGVTEGGIAGILSSFGIPWGKAVIITLVYRVATLPFLVILSLLFFLPTYFSARRHASASTV